ncbi:hypothetical protein VTL71DRAFT_8525 [Oculimacula yallundae]|uniref:Zn(2)-C6 fungal-type domain-containing protein n=1 Tax=Oculimacula yallundae TaxID=86028 RepID=A0ABR4D039_9HELO
MTDLEPQAPIKKRRQCGPKTRTGCLTCKIRRIKCDEAKPYCQKCTSTGRKCDGYLPPPSTSPKFNSTSLSLTHRTPGLHPGTSQEKRGFQYFITQTGGELSGFYSSSFWETFVLQASTAEPSLRHAIIAIGSIHEEFANRRLAYGTEEVSKGHAFAVNQYIKAIGHLRKSLADGKQATITALMSCILFVCFDSLRGHFVSAMAHLKSGLRILRDLKSSSASDEHAIATDIAPLFLRLSIQAILFIDTRPTPERRAMVTELAHVSARNEHIPETFESLDEARNCMNQVANSLFRMTYLCNAHKSISEQPLETFDLFQKYAVENERWNTAFERFMRAKSAMLNNRELRGAALLKIHHMTAHIMSKMTPDISDPRPVAQAMNDPKIFARFTDEFRTIVNLCRSLVATEEQDIRNGKTAAGFSSDLGVIAPLYYVCIRCQDPAVKNLAIALMERCPRREGMWDSVSGVRMVREFWAIEKNHFSREGEGDEETLLTPMNDVLEMEFGDGMKWVWKLKNPQGSLTKINVDEGISSEAGDDWMNLLQSDEWMSMLEDEIWYSGDLLMSDTTSGSPYQEME